MKAVQEQNNQLAMELDHEQDQLDQVEGDLEKLRKEKNTILERLAKAEREKKTAEDGREKAESQVSSLQEMQKKLRDKNQGLDVNLSAAQAKIRELEEELNRRLAEPEMKSYNIAVVESEPVLESSQFSFFDEGLKNDNELLQQKIKDLTEKVRRLEGEKSIAVLLHIVSFP